MPTKGASIPISSKQKIFDYIKSQKWFFGVRADESLLFYSAKTSGYDYIRQEYGMSFAETILIPLRKSSPIRVFNLVQAKKFHAFSYEKIYKNPKILSDFVNKDNAVYKKIAVKGKKMLLAIKKNDYDQSLNIFNEILSLYEKSSAYFIIIFSLGLKLTENSHDLKNVNKILKVHDAWRNSVAFKEEAMGENLFYFISYLIKNKNLRIDPLLLMKSLTINEVRAWLSGKLTDKEALKKISSRKNHGFVFLNLKNDKREIIDDLAEIKEMQKYFLKLDKETNKPNIANKIFGQAAYDPKKLIRGKAIIIKDKSELITKNHLIDGKILVAIQTTPHFIPYMKKAKAIITDEGGITCHAAIVSRELKIPCIIGTKNATSILKDGDLVEVDVSQGAVKILKKHK